MGAFSQASNRLAPLVKPQPAHHAIVVIDETSIFPEDGSESFGWVALDGDTHEAILSWVTQGRGGLEALIFLKNVLRHCTNRPFVRVGRGVGYPRALDTLGIKWKVQRGGRRSLVESFFGSLKWRIQRMHRRPRAWHTMATLRRILQVHLWNWNGALL